MLFAIFAAILGTSALAQTVPKLMNYQGRLTDAAGGALPDGRYGIMMRIWAEPTATNRLVWGQEFNNVVLVNGVFNLIMGGGAPIAGAETNDIAAAFFETNRFIGVTVISGANGAPIADPSEMVPRQQVLSAPFAFTAERVATAAYATNSGTAAFATNAETASALVANGTNLLSADDSGNLVLGDTNRTNQEITANRFRVGIGGIHFPDNTVQKGASSGVGQALLVTNSAEIISGNNQVTILSKSITVSKPNARVLVIGNVFMQREGTSSSGIYPRILLNRGTSSLAEFGGNVLIESAAEAISVFWIDDSPGSGTTYGLAFPPGAGSGKVHAGRAQLLLLEL